MSDASPVKLPQQPPRVAKILQLARPRHVHGLSVQPASSKTVAFGEKESGHAVNALEHRERSRFSSQKASGEPARPGPAAANIAGNGWRIRMEGNVAENVFFQ